MNGDLKKAVSNKVKQVTSTIGPSDTGSNGDTANKKRRKGGDLKPIITNESTPDKAIAAAAGQGKDP